MLCMIIGLALIEPELESPMRILASTILIVLLSSLGLQSALANNVAFPQVNYTTKIGFGQKSVESSTISNSKATVTSIAGLADFGTIIAGLEGAQISFDQSPLTRANRSSKGMELNATMRVRTPAVNMPLNLSAFVYAGAEATIVSRYNSWSETRNQEERYQLTNRDDAAEFNYTYEKLGPTYIVGGELSYSETYGIFTEYRQGNEKWVTRSVEYNGEEAELNRLDQDISNQEFRIGIQFSN